MYHQSRNSSTTVLERERNTVRTDERILIKAPLRLISEEHVQELVLVLMVIGLASH